MRRSLVPGAVNAVGPGCRAEDPDVRESGTHKKLKNEAWWRVLSLNWAELVLGTRITYVRVTTEYLFPLAGKAQGGSFCWPTYQECFRTRKEHRDEGVVALYIFDVAVETNCGVLGVIEIEHTNPVSPSKRLFLSQAKIPLLTIPSALPEGMDRQQFVASLVLPWTPLSREDIARRYPKVKS